MNRIVRVAQVVGTIGIVYSGSAAQADKSVCDTTILNRPGCEVGDFSQEMTTRAGGWSHVTISPIIRKPLEAEALLKSGKLKESNGDVAGAAEDYRKSLSFDDLNPEAHRCYGNVLKSLGREKDAHMQFTIEQIMRRRMEHKGDARLRPQSQTQH